MRPVRLLRIWNSEGLTQQNLFFQEWNSHVHRKFPGSFESTNLSRDTLSREIGRSRWAGELAIPNPPTNITPTNIAWLKLSGESPMDIIISPLKIKIMLESNPPKSIMLVEKLGIHAPMGVYWLSVGCPWLTIVATATATPAAAATAASATAIAADAATTRCLQSPY